MDHRTPFHQEDLVLRFSFDIISYLCVNFFFVYVSVVRFNWKHGRFDSLRSGGQSSTSVNEGVSGGSDC